MKTGLNSEHFFSVPQYLVKALQTKISNFLPHFLLPNKRGSHLGEFLIRENPKRNCHTEKFLFATKKETKGNHF